METFDNYFCMYLIVLYNKVYVILCLAITMYIHNIVRPTYRNEIVLILIVYNSLYNALY